jgi:hypothetical protein
MLKLKTLLDNRHQHISADRNPDLRLHRTLTLAQKCLDCEMLLDPFEQQFRPGLRRGRLCQRCRYNCAINSGANAKLLVKNVMRLPFSPLITIRRSVAG